MNPIKPIIIANIMAQQAIIFTKLIKESHPGKALGYYIQFETLEKKKELIITEL